MDSEVRKEKLKAVHYNLVLFLSNLLSTSFSLQLVHFFFFCSGTLLLQYNFFSLIHLPFQLLLIIMAIAFVIYHQSPLTEQYFLLSI